MMTFHSEIEKMGLMTRKLGHYVYFIDSLIRNICVYVCSVQYMHAHAYVYSLQALELNK